MSDATPNSAGPCEQLLDYVYGELDEAGKRAFEEHLPGCARCQAEVASLGRVRAAAKRVLPTVEPPASVGGGALHAQLMHAAAQRAPRRGVLLAFPRKILQHPAWAAAAMFAIVGGAIAINWSHDKLEMPATEKPAETAPAMNDTTAAAKEAEAPKPAAEPIPESKNKELADDKDTKLALQMPPAGTLSVERPATHHAAAVPAKQAPARKMRAIAGKKAADDGLAAAENDALLEGSVKGGDVGGALGGVVGGTAATTGAGGASYGRGAPPAESSAKSSAPSRLAKTEVAPQPSGYTRNAPAPPPATVMPTAPAAAAPVLSSTANERRDEPMAQQQRYRSTPVQKVAGPGDLEALRKRADELAKAGRCDEAVKLFAQLDKLVHISVRERASYVHCLTATGRQQQAEQALDELKADKRVTNAEVQKVEEEVAKRRVVEKKAAKKPVAAPADRAAQREAPAETQAAPAQASPPQQQKAKAQQKQSAPSSAY